MADDPLEPRDGSSDDPAEEFRDMLREFLAGNSDLDPSQLASAAGLPSDPELVQRLIGQLQQALQNSGDEIDWGLAREQASALAARSAVPATPGEVSALEQALHVAALWLEESTGIAALTAEPVLLTRAGWAEATMPVWTQLAEPVADSIASALTGVLEEQAPEELSSMIPDAGRLMRNVGGTLFAMQLGQVVGQLAQEVVSGGDVGIPLLDGEQRQAALVPQNVEDFARGLEIPVEEVRLYLAVRELAHARLFRHARWLRLHLLSQITDYARGIRIDTAPLEELAADFDPQNPEALRDALTSGKLIPPKSDEQRVALARLETMLALVEGWVDVVTAEATKRLPKSDAIAESVRRRRAAGGPAESAFASLVGLELRPRRLREAAAMWRAVSDAVGAEARDALWAHPDIVPVDADIDDPTLLIARLTGDEPEQDDVDRALQDLLDDSTGERPQEA
ncbi:zinc-dependent metalloprotease [Homoserinibacter sp. GY 40078]|uniref:zinc-dependent metalloprotease n=1 Tax=Homoserinibacter sp. GY 40078 TaxID=2603275 RepID=UPI0011C7BB55|nr:zinc-dependent metalloprotease [Homoserinibacter sp. GY 40078]TXK17112.1 zinc-dependent metalloprotease [Homoserinibacter sp. GY 40078]